VNANVILKTLCAASICALSLSVAHQAKAQVTNISNGMGYQLWTDGTPGPSFSNNGTGGFTASWSNYGSYQTNPVYGDFTTGVGWWKGTNGNNWLYPNIVVGYNCGQFSMSGFGDFGLYGWFSRPGWDTEYYIKEMTANGQTDPNPIDTFTSDGATYNVYHVFPPGGKGINNQPLEQWISERVGNAPIKTNTNITVGNHFARWIKDGFSMGTWSSVEVGCEGGYGGSGAVNASAWLSSGGGILPNHGYHIQNLTSGFNLDDYGWSTAMNAPVDQWSYTNGTVQQWQIIPVNNTGQNQYFEILNLNSNEALACPNNTTATNMVQAPYQNNGTWWWSLLPAGNGSFYIYEPSSNMSLDNRGSTTLGTWIGQWPTTNSTNLEWYVNY